MIRARENALIASAAGRAPTLMAPAGSTASATEAERQLVAARIAEYRAKVTSLEQRRAAADSATRASQSEIEKLTQTIPLLKETLDSREDLDRQGYRSLAERLLPAC